jgi:hypothetical protein
MILDEDDSDSENLFSFEESELSDMHFDGKGAILYSQKKCSLFKITLCGNIITASSLILCSSIDIILSRFKNNLGTGKSFQGIISALDGPNMVLLSVFANNFAESGFSALNLRGFVKISDSVFEFNVIAGKTKSSYGCVSLEPSWQNFSIIEHSIFRNNIGIKGSSLFTKNGYLLIFNTSFFNERSSYGAIFVSDNADIKFYACIVRNASGISGSGIYVEKYSKIDMLDSYFDSNSASIQGGAVFVSDNSFIASRGVTFVKNKAVIGGAIHVSLFSSVLIADSLFKENAAIGTSFSCLDSVGS